MGFSYSKGAGGRDKIAAPKKKGLFMGGNIPLGYINRDKKLVIVPEEAERVRWIFQRYLDWAPSAVFSKK